MKTKITQHWDLLPRAGGVEARHAVISAGGHKVTLR